MSRDQQLWRLPQKRPHGGQRVFQPGSREIALYSADQLILGCGNLRGLPKFGNSADPGKRIEIHYNAILQFRTQCRSHIKFKSILAWQTNYDASVLEVRCQRDEVLPMPICRNSEDD